MNRDHAERIAKALESIAGSLVRLSNPPFGVDFNGKEWVPSVRKILAARDLLGSAKIPDHVTRLDEPWDPDECPF